MDQGSIPTIAEKIRWKRNMRTSTTQHCCFSLVVGCKVLIHSNWCETKSWISHLTPWHTAAEVNHLEDHRSQPSGRPSGPIVDGGSIFGIFDNPDDYDKSFNTFLEWTCVRASSKRKTMYSCMRLAFDFVIFICIMDWHLSFAFQLHHYVYIPWMLLHKNTSLRIGLICSCI